MITILPRGGADRSGVTAAIGFMNGEGTQCLVID
jgi:hypothetical protein